MNGELEISIGKLEEAEKCKESANILFKSTFFCFIFCKISKKYTVCINI